MSGDTSLILRHTQSLAKSVIDELEALNVRLDERSVVYARLMIERDRATAQRRRLVDALNALADGKGGLSCIPPGPERDELEDAYKECR